MRTKLGLCLLATALPLHAGEITGRITRDDRPAPGVTVSALPVEAPLDQARREARRGPRPEAIAKAVTNANGEFRIVFEAGAGEPGRIVSLACSGGGVGSQWLQGRFDTSDSEDAGESQAQRGLPLGGKVVDAAGKPLAGADVDHPTGPASVRTGADGSFLLEGVPESGSDVEVRMPGFVSAKAVQVRGGRKDLVIILKPAVPLNGVVVAPDGAPVPGAVVTVSCREARGWAEADADGRFTAAACAAGRVAVFASGGDRGAREVTGVLLPRREEEPLRVVLGPPRTLAGRVVDAATRRPVPRAFLEVSGSPRAWTRSSRDGTFALGPAAQGDLRVTSYASGYAPAVRTVASTEIGARPVEFLLRPAAAVSGRVVDEQRRPVAGVRLRTYDPEARGGLSSPSAVSAADGSFFLRRVPATGTLRVLASHVDFEPLVLAGLDLKPGETRAGVALTLRRGAVLTGVVTAGGEPLPDAQVFASGGRSAYGTPPRSLAGWPYGWLRTRTGADGRFRLAGLSPGEYVLNIARTGWATESRDVTIEEGRGPDPLTIALAPEAVISGRVVGKKGGPAGPQNVSAQSVDAKERSYGAGRSGPDGAFRIEALKPGIAYNLYIYGSGPNAPKATATPPAERVELVVDGTGRVAGRVVDPEGRPVAAYQVLAQADRSSANVGWLGSARQDVSSETGEFALENAPAGTLELRVTAKGFQAARLGGVTVEEGESKEGLEVRLVRGSSLRGRVVEASGGGPVAGAEVSAESAPGRTVTDSDGAFELEGLAPGKARVTASAPDYLSTSQSVDVGESGATIEMKLSAGASIAATVVTPGGEPVSGAEVALGPSGQSWSNTRMPAGPDGRVRFAHLAPGRYALTAGSAGRRSKPVDVALEADQTRDDVRIVLGGGATVVTTVTGLSPEERRQLLVGVSGRPSFIAAKELPDGRFEARDVPPGRAQVFARTGIFDAQNARSMSKQIDVPEDGTLDVEVSFEAGYTLTVRVLKNGQGVEGVSLWAAPAVAGAATVGQGTTDASGTCRLSGLKAGAYRVNGWSVGSGMELKEQKVDLSGDQSLDVTVPAGRLAGRVVASGSLQPLGNATVSVKPQSPEAPVSGHDATTDDAGRFRFESLDAGPLTLTASRKGYVVETRTVTADAPEDLEVALARGDGLDVTGRDGLLGTPLQTASVTVYDGAGAELLQSYVRFDSAGRGEIPSLKPGSYTVVAGTSSGYAPATYEGVSVPGPALAVALTPGGTLDVEVPAETLKKGPLACSVNGARGRLAFRVWGRRGELNVSSPTIQLRNFPPVAGTLSCPGLAPVPFAVTEGGTTRIAVK